MPMGATAIARRIGCKSTKTGCDRTGKEGGDGAMITVKEKLARGLNVFTRPQVVSLIIVTAVFLILFKESIQTTTIIVGFCSVAAIGENLFILLDRQHKELLDAIRGEQETALSEAPPDAKI
jgi:hypothetical protein